MEIRMSEHAKYSAEWIKDLADAKKATWLPNHACTFCGVDVGYVLTDEAVFYKSACGCAYGPMRASSYADIAHWLSYQSDDAMRDKLLERMT